MRPPLLRLGSFALFALVLLAPSAAQAQTVTVAGQGATFVLIFNSGYTQDRADTAEAAAQYWADRISSDVDIEVDIDFRDLGCTSSAAPLGAAGATRGVANFTNATFTDTLHPIALANHLAGTSLNTSGTTTEISAEFNSALDDASQPSCLGGADWHYGTSAPSGSDVSFYTVMKHELAHGLGFSSSIDATGALPSIGGRTFDDVYSRLLEDDSLGITLDAASATDAQRSSAITGGDLVWSGAEVDAADGFLQAGTLGGRAKMYAPSTYAQGSSVSHFDLSVNPDELMEPRYIVTSSAALTEALLYDIGWEKPTTTPVITAQSTLTTDEETPLEIELSDLSVSDPDSTYPDDFTLSVQSGSNYAVVGSTVTPALDFDGTLTVPVTVNDGVNESDPFDLSVTVNPINDPPVIAGQDALSTPEDTPLTLRLDDLDVDDVDDVYPDDFTLAVQSGPDHSVNGAVVTPDPDFFGVLTVPVTVNDGDADSDPFDVEVTVSAVNDAPVIVAQSALSTLEDTPIALSVNDVTIDDVDSTSFTLVVEPGSGYAVSGTTVTPAADFNGPLTVRVRADDGVDIGPRFDLAVSVAPVNDPPVITAAAALATDEDTPLTLALTDLTVEDVDDPFPAGFTVRAQAGPDHAVSGGATIEPAQDFEGTLPVSVIVNDGDADSPPFEVAISVRPVNDPPVITGQEEISIDEDTSLSIGVDDVTIEDPDDGQFTLAVEPGGDYSVNGDVVTPTADFAGELTVNVRANDGEAGGPRFELKVTVRPVNDPPEIRGQRPIAAREGEPRVVDPADLEIFDPDDGLFIVRVLPGPGHTAADDTFTPDEGSTGLLVVEVVASDGEDDSEPFGLEVSVLAAPLLEVIEVDASGLFTPRPEIDPPESLGILEPPVTVSLASAPDFFRPGRHVIRWREVDAGGREAFREQELWVHPLVSLGPGGEVAEGTEGELTVHLNGPAPEYPVWVSLSVLGTADDRDHDLGGGTIPIPEDALSAAVPFQVFEDGVDDDGETLRVDFVFARNPGRDTTELVLRDAPVAPRVTVSAEQSGERRTTFFVDEGAARFGAEPDDDRPLELAWSFSGRGLVTGLEGPTPTWQSSEALAGRVTAEVVDELGREAARSTAVRWRSTAPPLSSGDDRDGDGRDDASEGAVDADFDGLVDHRDYWSLPNVLEIDDPAPGPAAAGRVVEAAAGVRLARGLSGVAADLSGVGVSAAQLVSGFGADDAARYVDLWATELVRPGQIVDFVLPLDRAAAEGETVRLLTPDGWFDFLEDGDDRLASARSETGLCPPPHGPASRYAEGLEPGADCVRLSIADGDANDADGRVDRQIHFVAALETRPADPSRPRPDAGPDLAPAPARGGCGCRSGRHPARGGAWAILAIALLAVLRRRRPAARGPLPEATKRSS